MKFLYIILLVTATFCYDSELLNDPVIFKAKYEMFDLVKKEIYSNPMPVNYKDYLNRLESSVDFIFDIIPIDNWKQEAKKKLLLLVDDEKGKNKDASSAIELAEYSDSSSSIGDFGTDYQAGSYYFTDFIDFSSRSVTTSKGEFIMFRFMKVLTAAIPKKASGNVKVCYTTNSVFKKCTEYEIYQAIKATDKAYVYSKINEKIGFYN